jgi:hypothetical protein
VVEFDDFVTRQKPLYWGFYFFCYAARLGSHRNTFKHALLNAWIKDGTVL